MSKVKFSKSLLNVKCQKCQCQCSNLKHSQRQCQNCKANIKCQTFKKPKVNCPNVAYLFLIGTGVLMRNNHVLYGSVLIGTGVLMSEATVGVGQYLLAQGCK